MIQKQLERKKNKGGERKLNHRNWQLNNNNNNNKRFPDFLPP
jgi:hypothetical protein